MLIFAYLAAIIAANMITTTFGPAASLINSFAFIGLNFTMRDRLHDQWHGRHLALRMGGLILLGAAISFALNAAALPIALASLAAFAAAESADSVVYHWLRHRSWFQRVNGSNTVSSAIDSIVFPTIAFGGLNIPITATMFVMKLAGGAFWSGLLRPKYVAAVAALAFLALPARSEAQIVSADVAAVVSPAGTHPALELYTGAPTVFGVRPYVISSMEKGATKPTFVSQLAVPVVGTRRFWLTADVGATWLPFRNYEPVMTVGGYLGVPLPLPRMHAFVLGSWEPTNGWSRTVVTGVAVTLFRGR